MYIDAIQETLGKMEDENPSLSLETAKSTLKERVGFLGRYLSRAVEQVPQRSSIYSSLDDRFKDYEKVVEFAELSERANYWMKYALQEARNGEKVVNGYPTSIRLAAEEGGVAIPEELISLVDQLYSESSPIECPNHVRRWLSIALQEARNGEKVVNGYPTSIRIAQDYANETDIEIALEELEAIDRAYQDNKNSTIPIHVDKWLRIVAEEIESGEPEKEIDISLKIAKDYANELDLII